MAYLQIKLFVKPSSTYPYEKINKYFYGYLNKEQEKTEDFIIGDMYNARENELWAIFSDKTMKGHGLTEFALPVFRQSDQDKSGKSSLNEEDFKKMLNAEDFKDVIEDDIKKDIDTELLKDEIKDDLIALINIDALKSELDNKLTNNINQEQIQNDCVQYCIEHFDKRQAFLDVTAKVSRDLYQKIMGRDEEQLLDVMALRIARLLYGQGFLVHKSQNHEIIEEITQNVLISLEESK